MKLTTLLLLFHLVSTVVAPGSKFRQSHVRHERTRGPPNHSQGHVRWDSCEEFEISYLIKYPTRLNPVDPSRPLETPGDQALFDDDIYALDKTTVIGRIYGFCILTEAPILNDSPTAPSDEQPGSSYCQTPVSFDTEVNGRDVKGTITTAGVIFFPVGLPYQPAAQGTSAITGGYGDLKYAQGTVEVKQLDERWIREDAMIRLSDCGGRSW